MSAQMVLRPYSIYSQQFGALAGNLDQVPAQEEVMDMQPGAMSEVEALQQTLSLMAQILQQQQQQAA